MDKVLISALATGSLASAITALLGGLFQNSGKKMDGSIANRDLNLKQSDQSFKQLQVILEETKTTRDTNYALYEKACAEKEAEGNLLREKIGKLDEQIAQIQEANVFLIMAALRNNNLDDLRDVPMTVEMRRLYELAVRNAKPVEKILDKQISDQRPPG